MKVISRKSTTGGILMLAAVLCAACGSSSSSSSTQSSSSAASSSATTSSTATAAAQSSKLLPPTPSSTDGANVAAAQAAVLAALKPTTFSAPGPPVDVAKVKKSGKSIWLVTCGAGNLYCAQVAQGAQAAAKVAGVPMKVYVAQAPTDDATGIEEATAQGAGAIALIAVDPPTVAAQLAAARAKGIKIISLDNTDSSSPPLPGTDANVTPSFTYEGQLNADYAVAKDGGDVHAYCMTTPEYVVTTLFCNGFKNQLLQLAPNATVSTGVYPVATIPTNVPTGLQAKLRSDPSINVVMCGFDFACQYAVPAIAQLGKSGTVWAGTQTGQLSPNLKWVQQGYIQLADVGIPSEWKGWATVDQAMRLMAGQAPAANGGGVPVKLFTHEYLAAQPSSVLANDNSAYGTDGGQLYQQVYEKLWGVS
jgi:ribose transport system substrate-binding protein